MSGDSGFAKAIARLIKSLFRGYGGMGANGEEDADHQMQIFLEQLEDLEDRLSIERDIHLDNDNFLEAYMLETQRLGIESISTSMKDGVDNRVPEEIAEQASQIIKDKISSLNESTMVKDEHQDYHNHDAKSLYAASALVSKFTTESVRDIQFKSSSTVNSLLRDLSDAATHYMQKSPESHSQSVGLTPTDAEITAEKEARMEALREATRDRDAQYEAEASAQMGR